MFKHNYNSNIRENKNRKKMRCVIYCKNALMIGTSIVDSDQYTLGSIDSVTNKMQYLLLEQQVAKYTVKTGTDNKDSCCCLQYFLRFKLFARAWESDSDP